jgi:colanic acid/amylovoran biosynthesis glycosyltransferase
MPTDKPLSLLMVPESFPNIFQPYVLNMIEEMVTRGCHLTIAASGSMGKRCPERVVQLDLLSRTHYFPADSAADVLRGFRPYLLPFTDTGRRAFRGLASVLASRCGRPRGLRSLVKTLVRAPILGGSKFDIVHAHNFHTAFDYLFVARTSAIPLVTTFYGLPTIGGSGRLSEGKLAEVFHDGDCFLTFTRYAQGELESIGCPRDKIRILPLGIYLCDHTFRPKPFPTSGPVVLLTVARLSIEKGHRYALEAIQRLRQAGRPVEYRIVGAGYEKENLEKLVSDLRLQDSVRFMGSLMDDALRQQYAEAHVFILPSVRGLDGTLTETQGVVIQEAQASGLLVVATSTGGIPECVDDGRSAFLVPEKDSEALAQTIAGLLDQPERWESWQNAGRAWVEERFAMEKIGQRLWDIYQEVMELRKASARH